MVFFGLVVLLLVHFSLPPAHGRPVSLGVSALWLGLLLGSVIGLPPLQHHPDARRMVPQLVTASFSAPAFYWEKFVVGFGLLTAASVVLVYPAAILFRFPFDRRLLLGIGVLILGCVGLSAVMSLCVALTDRGGSWLLPVMAFPPLLPLLMAGTSVMTPLLESEATFPSRWLTVLITYDVMMLAAATLLSEFLWEEVPQ